MSKEDYEEIGEFGLEPAQLDAVLTTAHECAFIWSTRDGWPVGATMTFVYRDGRFWLTAARRRKRIAALRRDDRCALVISSIGTPLGPSQTVTVKGRCRIHADEATKRRVLREIAAVYVPEPGPTRDLFVQRMDSPGRLVLEVVPERSFSFDAMRLFEESVTSAAGDSRASSGKVSTRR